MRRIGIGIVLIALLTACSGASRDVGSDALRGKLTITGSITIAPLISEIAQRFESRHSGARIQVQTGGSSQGVADVRRGTAEIGMISRSPAPSELDLVAQRIALDGVGIIVHRSNPVTALTDEQIAAIYRGEVTNWSQVGGRDAPITVVHKAEGRSTLELFLEYFDLSNNEVRPHVIIGDNLHGIQTVAGDPNAIGYVSIGTADFESARGVPIKLLPVGGVEPTLANVRNGSFPIARPLMLVTKEEASPLVTAFVEFAASDEVQDLVEAQYFVPYK